MTDPELVQALAQLGIEPEDPRAVLLLPLVEVAWADGAVQVAERSRILEIARGHGVVGGRSEDTVRRWLAERPSPEVTELGRRVVVALGLRHRGPSADWPADALTTLEAQCTDVARAAGGLLGVVFAVSAAEQRALAEIRATLRSGRAEWSRDLPDPEGGGFEEL